MNEFRYYMNLIEGRIPQAEYKDKADRVIAKLESYESQSYTKLAQKVERITQLSDELKRLKAEVKQETRERISGIFDAEDAAQTRVVETISFMFTLSKDPEPTVSPKYKDILLELEKQLTPELIAVLEKLKETMVTVTKKEPSLRIKTLENDEMSLDNQIFQAIEDWGKKYDQKLDALKHEAVSLK